MKSQCSRHDKFAIVVTEISTDIKWLKQDRIEQKQRYEDMKKKKETRRMWVWGSVLTVFLTTISYCESIRLYLRGWLLR